MSTNIATSFARRFWPIWGLGVLGVLALTLQAPPTSLVEQVPHLQTLHPLALRALLILNPLVLVTAFAAIGAATAHRVGLRSYAAGTARKAISPLLAIVSGGMLAMAIFALDAVMAPHLGVQWQQVKAQADNAPWFPGLSIGVLYGGLAEEVIMRWGLMSLIAWLLSWFSAYRSKPVGTTTQMSARLAYFTIAVSAVAFAAGHLPALAQAVDLSTPIVARTLSLNVLAGLVYGWLFWRCCLETAMIAHATTHVGFALLRSMT